jgi:hypothetical protein
MRRLSREETDNLLARRLCADIATGRITADDIRPIVTNARAVKPKPTKEKR